LSVSVDYHPVFSNQIEILFTFRFSGQKASSTDKFKLQISYFLENVNIFSPWL